jgi:hypothetical protein
MPAPEILNLLRSGPANAAQSATIRFDLLRQSRHVIAPSFEGSGMSIRLAVVLSLIPDGSRADALIGKTNVYRRTTRCEAKKRSGARTRKIFKKPPLAMLGA